jgi:glycosyltransferase involved in cell wall biosynthesis
MKVLHVIPSISASHGGPTQVVLNLVHALRSCGVDTEIATTNDDGSGILDLPLHQRIEYAGVPVWILPRFSPPLKEFIFSPALTGWLWTHIPQYDILDNHYLFSYAPTCAGAIARWYKVPYTVRVMGQLHPWALQQSHLKKHIYSTLIERHNLNRAAAIHCTSSGEAENVRQFGIHSPTAVIPLGATPPVEIPDAPALLRMTYALPDNAQVILFLSRLHYKKRPDVLLRALPPLLEKHRHTYVILAGTGEPEYEAELKWLARELGLAERVIMPGFVTGTAKDLLLQGADLFVLPSFSENFGIAVAEAMAAGLPAIVTSGVQIAPDIEAARAGLVIDGEQTSLAEPLGAAIESLLQNPGLRQELGDNGKRLARERYSWDAIAHVLADVYQSIINHQPITPI